MKYKKDFYSIRTNDEIFERIRKEQGKIGYYRLPLVDVKEILDFAQNISGHNIVVLGIGGSSLGASAIYDFLQHKYRFERELIFLESTDPVDILSKLDSIDLDEAFFVIISKSGTTIETISILKYLSSRVLLTKDNTAVVSGIGTPLHTYAKKEEMVFFKIPNNVGGRFSVFSAAVLVPLALVGVDIANMLEGAKKVYYSFIHRERSYDILMEKARFYVENKSRFNINVLFSYSAGLEGFNKWYNQLWAESLGKLNINNTRQGLTPVGLIGPVDQHSFLQLIMQGVRDKTVTFIKVADFEEQIIIPSQSPIPELESIEGISFSRLLDMQADATISAIAAEKDIPYDVITIDKVDEYNIAELMYSYELLTSIIGAFLQIDAYDQPGVESGKNILKKKVDDLKC
jgi:glucose-6-phosphate isomerase